MKRVGISAAGALTMKFGSKVTIQVAPKTAAAQELCVVPRPMKAK